jgi:hypothetical protein
MHREIRRLRLERRPHQEGRLRKVLRHLPRRRLDPEHFAQDQLIAGSRIFPHDTFVIGIGNVLRRRVFDLASGFSSLERLVNPPHPLLLERHGVNRRHLQLGLCKRTPWHPRRQGSSNSDRPNNQLTAYFQSLLLKLNILKPPTPQSEKHRGSGSAGPPALPPVRVGGYTK